MSKLLQLAIAICRLYSFFAWGDIRFLPAERDSGNNSKVRGKLLRHLIKKNSRGIKKGRPLKGQLVKAKKKTRRARFFLTTIYLLGVCFFDTTSEAVFRVIAGG